MPHLQALQLVKAKVFRAREQRPVKKKPLHAQAPQLVKAKVPRVRGQRPVRVKAPLARAHPPVKAKALHVQVHPPAEARAARARVRPLTEVRAIHASQVLRGQPHPIRHAVVARVVHQPMRPARQGAVRARDTRLVQEAVKDMPPGQQEVVRDMRLVQGAVKDMHPDQQEVVRDMRPAQVAVLGVVRDMHPARAAAQEVVRAMPLAPAEAQEVVQAMRHVRQEAARATPLARVVVQGAVRAQVEAVRVPVPDMEVRQEALVEVVQGDSAAAQAGVVDAPPPQVDHSAAPRMSVVSRLSKRCLQVQFPFLHRLSSKTWLIF
ncbi:MAG TPA: hypothetical protein VH164_08455 [Ktedonobacteraceae bacterium]|nr:hypothetical protein [Ktedonobacteraceae bacterium]